MILGIGIDVTANNRIREKMENERFIKRILSEEELLVFQRFDNELRKTEYLAGRFTAKEAIFKAMRTGDGHTKYSDISVLNEESGAPYVKFSALKHEIVHVSISHEKENTIAFVVIEAMKE